MKYLKSVKEVPTFSSLADEAAFWDNHSLAKAPDAKLTRLESKRALAYLARKKAGTVVTYSPLEALKEAAKLRESKTRT